ncbi:uncharacterized protein LOC130994571 [Salvia miltiorrhiza]|uniref:uncharacterized protein LOC130994571 n=1 Tax=Salvia miltiorrhiza TaxID=226208 RepID=UPI0025ACD7A8|nr:uncharacterized protein LOC130994571 [Salvia miltiorrhiza]
MHIGLESPTYPIAPVQLLRRHWIITDANGRTETVQLSFQFPTFTPQYFNRLDSVSVFEEGDYEMKHIDKVGTRTFNVAIAPFALSTFGDDISVEIIQLICSF